jgi:hypothetical protein
MNTKTLKAASEFIELRRDGVSAKINKISSELCELSFNGVQVMWGGGKPDSFKTKEEKEGWPHSEIIMFPTVSLSFQNGINVEGKKYPMPQHGVARHLSHKVLREMKDKVSFIQAYEAGTVVEGDKGPCSFPFSYTLGKSFKIKEDSLFYCVEVENRSEKPMPFAFGLHPAFKVDGRTFIAAGKEIYSVDRIKEAENSAVFLEDVKEVTCISGNVIFSLETNIENMQLWSPKGQNLVAIEPITARKDTEYNGEFAYKRGNIVLESGRSSRFYLKIALRNECGIAEPQLIEFLEKVAR